MKRLVNSKTGVVVKVDEATAAELGAAWSLVGGGAASTPDSPTPEKSKSTTTKRGPQSSRGKKAEQ